MLVKQVVSQLYCIDYYTSAMKLPLILLFILLSASVFGQAADDCCTRAVEYYESAQLENALSEAKQCISYLHQHDEVKTVKYLNNLRLLTLICYSAGWYEQGVKYARQEIAASQWLEEGTQTTYNTGEAYLNLAGLYERLKAYDRAAAAYQDALAYLQTRLTTDSVQQFQLFYLEALSKTDDKLKARHYADSLLEAWEPGAVSFNYARLLYQRACLSAAPDQLTYLELALLSLPEEAYQSAFHASLVLHMADQYQAAGRFDQAVSYYRLFIEIDEQAPHRDPLKRASAFNNLGYLLTRSQTEVAIQFLKEAFDSFSKLAAGSDAYCSALDNLAQALHLSGRNEEAEALYTSFFDTDSLQPSSVIQVTGANNLALLLQEEGRPQEALTLFRKIELWLAEQETASSSDLSTLYYNKAISHQQLAQYDSAIYFFKKSADLSKTDKPAEAEYLAAITAMAALYQDLGYFTESEIFYQEALIMQRMLGGKESNAYASIQSNYALLLQEKGAYEEAGKLMQEASDTKLKILGPDHPEYIQLMSNLGLLLMQQADYKEARRLLELGLLKHEMIYGDRHPAFARSLVNMARLEITLANYNEAEPLLKQALAIHRKFSGEQHPDYANTALEMANLYLTLGNYKAAETLLLSAVKVLKAHYGSQHPDYATAIQNLASLYEATNRYEDAENYLKEALKVDQQTLGKQHPSYATTLNNLASFYQNQHAYEKALPLLKEAMQISGGILGKTHPLYLSTLLNLALLYQDLGDYQAALPLTKEAVDIRKEILGEKHPDYAYALYGMALLKFRNGDYIEAEALFHEVLSLYANQIREYFPALSEKEKSAFYQQIEPVINTFRDFVVEVNLNREDISGEKKARLLGSLYDMQLMTKALLLDAGSRTRRSILNSGDPAIKTLYENWLREKEQLAKYFSLSLAELSARQIDIKALEDRANELEKQLSASSQVFAQSLENQKLNWRDVQASLKEGEAALEVLRVEKENSDLLFYIALVIEPGSQYPKMALLPEGEALENKHFRYYKNAIQYRMEDHLSYRKYWQPIREVLSERVRTVYLAPDGIFNKISLNSLYDPAAKCYLLDQLSLRMLSSTRELTSDPSADNEKRQAEALLLGFPEFAQSPGKDKLALLEKGAAAFTHDLQTTDPGYHQSEARQYNLYPLPGTLDEVKYVESIMKEKGWQVQCLTRSEAREELVKKAMNPRVLHVATHAYFLSDLKADENSRAFGIHLQNVSANPLLRSGLLLAGSALTLQAAEARNLEQEDGVLTAYEAMNLNLNQTELVVLSACETGLGELRNGEGVYGLQRAFLMAGARSVLMSLWKVNDESTARLVSAFYRNWLSGQDKFTALHNAQREMRDIYEEPYHWGAFVLVGR